MSRQHIAFTIEERGYSLGNVSHKGRFIEAEVLDNNKQVDKVIFDRKTGRIRSMEPLAKVKKQRVVISTKGRNLIFINTRIDSSFHSE